MTVIAVTASFVFGESPVPVISFDPMQAAVILMCVWLAIGGGIFSYHYREALPPVVSKLIKFGSLLIIVNLARELWESNLYAMQFQFVVPLMHALVAASVLTSFELRTRHEVISSATFGLLLLCVAAISGKSILFGAIVFLYICLGAVLLMLSCQSQTRHEVVKREKKTQIRQTTRGGAKGAIALALVMLPVTSVAAFCVIPRVDNEADSLSARVRAFTTETLYQLRSQTKTDLLPNQDKIARAPGPNQIKAARRREAARQHKSPLLDQNKAAPSDTQPALNETVADKSAKRAGPGAGKDQDKLASHASETSPTKSDGDNKTATAANVNPNPDAPKESGEIAGSSGETKEGTSAEGAKAGSPAAAKDTKDTKGKDQAGKDKKSGKTKSGDKGDIKSGKTTKEKSAADPTKKATGKDAPLKQKPTADAVIDVMDESSLSMSEQMSNPEQLLFSLAANRSVYTKFLVLDDFDGTHWKRKGLGDSWEFQPSTKGIGIGDCPPLAISFAMPIMELVQTFKIESNLGYYVPVAGIPQTVSLLNPVTVDAFGNLRSTDPLLKGTTYSVLAQLPVYSIEAMRKAEEEADDLPPENTDFYLEIPDDQSQALFEMSADIAGKDGNRFTRAERLMQHLRTHYEYSLKPVSGPANTNLVDEFLFKAKKGDCKSFASSFIMLCRASEIPARCVVGYLPGDPDPVTGATLVRKKHSHAWAEVYIPPFGWVPFDATPNGQLPARPEGNYYNYERIQKELKKYSETATDSTTSLIKSILGWTGKVLGAVAFAIAVFALYLALRASRSALAKFLKDMRNRHPATKIKERLLKKITKRYRVVRAPSDTGADFLKKLEAALSDNPADTKVAHKLGEFMDTYNAVYFGNLNEMDRLKTLDGEVKSLMAQRK
jgi:transglutaminase-like putative cysteine protease